MYRRTGIIVIFVILAVIAPLTALSSAEAGELLSKAETTFSDANELIETEPEAAVEKYRSAAAYYNSIIESGIVNAGLYYNMANAYFRAGEVGQAILNYRRALLYSPSDKQIRYNLEFARKQQKNGFILDSEHEVVKIIFFWHFIMPVSIKVLILIISNLLFWGALVLRRLGRPVLKMSAVPAIIGLLLSASLFVDWQSSNVFHGVVTATSTIGRTGDSRSYESSFDAPLYQGVEFEIQQQRVGWILAELPNGELCWLEEKDCSVIETERSFR